MLRVVCLAIALALIAGGCMGEDDGGYEASQLERMVVVDDDLEGPWTRFDWGRQGSADQPSGQRSQPGRFGREDGWKARYRRPGSRQTRGPLVIESRADVFEDQDGARSDFEAYRDELSASGTAVSEVDDLGDEAILSTIVQGDVRFFLILWREANAVASVNVNGFERRVTRQDALALARKQQAHMRAAEAG